MTYEEVRIWTDKHNLIANRVKVINQILGARYENSCDNPCVIEYRRGRYRVLFCGVCFAEYGVYKERQAIEALKRLDALNDALWYMSRVGFFMKSQPTME